MSDATDTPHFPAPRARGEPREAPEPAREEAHAVVAEPAEIAKTQEAPVASPDVAPLNVAPPTLAPSIPYRTAEAPAAKPVMSRPDAPLEIETGSDVAANDAAPKVALSKEEIRAFLAVETVHHTTKWKKVAKRGALLTVPTGLISFGVQTVFGWWGAGACVAFAIYWALRPMLKQDRDGWS